MKTLILLFRRLARLAFVCIFVALVIAMIARREPARPFPYMNPAYMPGQPFDFRGASCEFRPYAWTGNTCWIRQDNVTIYFSYDYSKPEITSTLLDIYHSDYLVGDLITFRGLPVGRKGNYLHYPDMDVYSSDSPLTPLSRVDFISWPAWNTRYEPWKGFRSK